MDACPICGTDLETELASLGSSSLDTGECIRCGSFSLAYDAVGALETVRSSDRFRRFVPVLSFVVRQLTLTRGGVHIDHDWLYRLYEEGRSLPEPAEQATNVLRWLGRHTKAGLALDLPVPFGMAIVGCEDSLTVRWVVDYLVDAGLVAARTVNRERRLASGVPNAYEAASLSLTMAGWQRYFELQREASESRTAFMAMDFGHDDELKPVFLACFRPAVEAAGFTLLRVDENPPAGSIDDRIQVEIRRSRFVVCDLTHANAGAYWEAGFAKGLGRPVFYTCRDTPDDRAKVHFDTRQQYIVFWTPTQLEDAAKRLTDSVRATLPDARL